MPADASALGTLPVAAYQYCEAIRAASSFGWYVFPPTDIRLRWDGSEVRCWQDGEWQSLVSMTLAGETLQRWQQFAPDGLKDQPPPFLSSLFVPGIVQVWSGFLVSSSEDWSILVRPPANLTQSNSYFCYEGLVRPMFWSRSAVCEFAADRDRSRNRPAHDQALVPGAAGDAHFACWYRSGMRHYRHGRHVGRRLAGLSGDDSQRRSPRKRS